MLVWWMNSRNKVERCFSQRGRVVKASDSKSDLERVVGSSPAVDGMPFCLVSEQALQERTEEEEERPALRQ